MLSLYIHIPFCHYKCEYCSFNVLPLSTHHQTQQCEESHTQEFVGSVGSLVVPPQDNHKGIIGTYLDALHHQIDEFATKLSKQRIKTIYFGGGTPSTIGSHEIIRLIDHIAQVRDCTDLAELTIEINPDPLEDMLSLVKHISKYYHSLPRIRFSVGIQSFDNEILEESKRQYNFQSCVQFLRQLVPLKKDNVLFNFDFIAFGRFTTTRKGNRQLRDQHKLEFFRNFVQSGFADGFSLYMLELQSGSKRYYDQRKLRYDSVQHGPGLKKYGSDDDIYEEFCILKDIILESGYQRYEISNYSKIGANAIHNRAYRSLDERLGLGVGATSFLNKDHLVMLQDFSPSLAQVLKLAQQQSLAGHISIVPDIKRFSNAVRIDEKKIDLLSEKELLKEKFLTGMRVREGILLEPQKSAQHRDYLLQATQQHISSSSAPEDLLPPMSSILVDDWKQKIQEFESLDLCKYQQGRLSLTDHGMDVYDRILQELVR